MSRTGVGIGFFDIQPRHILKICLDEALRNLFHRTSLKTRPIENLVVNISEVLHVANV
jgi:hypothetical protein